MSNYTIDLIEKTFDDSFELSRYRQFVGELFSGYVQKPFIHNKTYIADGFEESVALFGRIGTYTDPEDQTIDILYVKLETHLHNRSLQRNFIARHLKKRDKDAALVAFYTDSSPDWRLSLVWRTQEMLFDEEKEKVKFKERLTPTRRSSYLLGKNEPSHTAKRQLLPLLKQLHPTLATLQEAFSVETVTKQFFDQYKTLFLRLHEEIGRLLAHEPKIAADFKSHAIDSANFAKKLLGQIVFLYFLQKKGWLGVTREGAWGSGPTDFLRRLFAKETISYTNFFDEVLEPLFYEALAEQRANDWYATLHCKIPFLNGGLFEPMNGYAWRALALNLPNAIFSNDEKSADGDNGTGILDVFDRYNFTVREEEPLEKEVAVDPEMLGKVFENLLEVTDRKSKGAFYTPREIVHYMCQESLINYLATALPDLPHADLAMLIREGELLIENDKAKNDGRKSGTYQLPQTVRDHAQALDDALARVTVCDPAIGSGAFPVGMLTEVVKLRTVLQQLGNLPAQTTYDLKRHAIQQSLYGVDIDASAVDVAKLRLWLSLVVDEDDYRTIKPLPNLDYKIVCGNSLIGFPDTYQTTIGQEVSDLIRDHFHETHPMRKDKLKRQIDEKINARYAGSLKALGYQVNFDFRTVFAEVFQRKGGFDIVIGNPPYVRHELIKVQKKALETNFKDVYAGTADLYVYFYARGLQLLKKRGNLAYITSNKFMRAGYGKKLRTHLTEKTTLHSVIDFGDLPVFDATAYPTIVITRSDPPTKQAQFNALTVDTLEILQQLPQQIDSLAWSMPQTALPPEGWSLVDPDVLALMTKLRQAGQPLERYVDGKFYRGILTGFNEAFVIDEATRERLIAEDPHSAEVIKPWLRGRDVKRWRVDWENLYVIIIQNGKDKNANYNWSVAKSEQEALDIFRKTYPTVYKHLAEYQKQLEKRYDKGEYWWELRACAYYEEFDRPKIIYPDIAKHPEFAYDESGRFGGNTLYIIPTSEKFLLAILNSSITHFFYGNISSTVRGGYFRFIATYMSQIPIPSFTNEMKQKVETTVQKLLDAKGQGGQVAEWERELNALVYELYGLTSAEIALIEAQVGNTPNSSAELPDDEMADDADQ